MQFWIWGIFNDIITTQTGDCNKITAVANSASGPILLLFWENCLIENWCWIIGIRKGIVHKIPCWFLQLLEQKQMHRLSFLSPFPHVQLFLVARELALSKVSENSKDPVKTFNGCLKYLGQLKVFFIFFLSVFQAHFSAVLHITQVEKKLFFATKFLFFPLM